jgi:hypothetical protein
LLAVDSGFSNSTHPASSFSFHLRLKCKNPKSLLMIKTISVVQRWRGLTNDSTKLESKAKPDSYRNDYGLCTDNVPLL